jgi:serine/threonine protein kinase
MALDAGARLGPYEVVALIGAGGMGEVYKASDTRLNRTVAIKVLPPHWADDVGMKARLESEARTIASLTHSNICTLHDIGRERLQPGKTGTGAGASTPGEGAGPPASGEPTEINFLVMEYLEGQTLAKRLERGALPLDEALKVTIAIADALDRAHREGIVHRDLKPSNVMLTPSGPKLLDFGLAKLTAPQKPASAPAVQPGHTGPARPNATSPGMLIGTLQYMAPEQIEGAEADARSDIFALGGILYEMVTGAKAFEGKNRALLIAAIATLELDPLSKTKRAVPPALDHVAKRCLAKNPEDRWQTAHDLALQLRWIAEGGVPTAEPAVSRTWDRRAPILLAALLALLAVMATPAFLYLQGPGEAEPVQFRVPVAGLSDSNIALSPDGQTIALVAQPNSQEPSSLFVRPVGATTFLKLGGTDEAALPFWSPDSRTIAFAGNRNAAWQIFLIDPDGSNLRLLAATDGRGTSPKWSPDGKTIFYTICRSSQERQGCDIFAADISGGRS